MAILVNSDFIFLGGVIVKPQKHKKLYWAPDLDQWTKSGLPYILTFYITFSINSTMSLSFVS